MIREFFLALGFFTRIPVPNHPNYSDDALKRSAVYFPMVGIIVGGIIALVYTLASALWSIPIAVVIALAIGFLATGGFHEDGWADTFDGLGGAFDKARKLEIMTDSRLGTYGSLALWALLTIKTVTLIELLPSVGVIAILFAHALSRWAAMSAMVWLPYVRVAPSKSKPVVQQLTPKRWIAAFAFVAPMLLLIPAFNSLALITTCCAVTLLWHVVLKRQLGGYTGDTLGASQQFNEIAIYLIWLVLL
jgi:adenosylcobinamide-GDP ribazoletransferase